MSKGKILTAHHFCTVLAIRAPIFWETPYTIGIFALFHHHFESYEIGVFQQVSLTTTDGENGS